jgi:hypothetical protein
VPTQIAALASGVCEATIRKWASRGKITRYGSSARAEYDLDELAMMSEPLRSDGQGRHEDRRG